MSICLDDTQSFFDEAYKDIDVHTIFHGHPFSVC